ncbi:thiamine pyrophosphate-requiring protein [Hyphomicrobium sp. DY-1]|uniref:thiamine pyrophosphate-requiring protein n=1 Tax=Hyphomicrobium sp. DY-1 TaxID=3075650 RepID=UPI0039C20CE6
MEAQLISESVANDARHSTAYYFLEGLNEIGIEYLFCNLGTDHAPIIEEMAAWQAEGRKMPSVILCPHENTAVHMAGGYALLTGRGQGVLVHVDAGTANAAMGLHNLLRTRLPVLLMAGTAPFTSFGELTGSRDTYVHFVQQPNDQGSLVRPYVKWEYTLPSGVIAKQVLRRASSIMESEPKGPAYLMLPREVLADEWKESEVHSYPAERFGTTSPAGADPDLIAELSVRLLAAENPILITQYAGRDPEASAIIAELAAFAGIRVIDYLSVNNISWTFPGFGGFQPTELEKVDVGLLVDVEVPWLPSVYKDNPGTYWAQIDVDVLKPASPMWPFPANLRLEGRSARILAQLLNALRKRATPKFKFEATKRFAALKEAQHAREQGFAKLAADPGSQNLINPHYICAALGEFLEEDDLVINEAVTRQSVPAMQIRRPLSGTMISNPGGGLGASGGLALGVKLARRDNAVVQIVGDGTFYFNNPSAVFAVSKQYGLPIFTIVLDNAGWSAVKQSVQRVYPDGIANAHDSFQAILASEMDFTKVVEAAGGYGERLTDPAQTKAAIARCLAAVRGGRSALLHACTNKL